MKKFWVASLLLIIILGAVAVLYFDLLNLKYKKEAAIAAILADEDQRRTSDRMILSLTDPDPEICTYAALAIGRNDDIPAVDKLFGLIQDSSETVAEAAVFSIGISGEKSFATRLLDMAPDLEPDRLALVIQSVGRLSDTSMTDVIAEIATYLDNVDHRVRAQAAYAIWRAGGKSYAPALAKLCHNDPVRPVQIAALYSLVRMRIPEQNDLYAEWLPDSDPFVRSLALRGLGLSKSENVIPLIASGLNDRDNNVVSQAISSLTSVGGDKVVKYLTSRYTQETDVKIKTQLLQSFTKLHSDAIADYARDDINVSAMYYDKDDKTKTDTTAISVRTAAIIYLAKIQGEAVLPLIDSMAIKKYPYLHEGLVEALSLIGGESAKPRLMAYFKDSVPSVRAAAFEALCTIDSSNLDYYIKTALADPDFEVSVGAVDKIGKKHLENYLPQLATMMQMGKNEAVDLKRAIVSTAAEFLEGDLHDEAEDIIYHGLMDRDYLVSREAAQIYKNKLNVDKSANITSPRGLLAKNKIKTLLLEYKTNPYAVIYTNRGEIEMELYFDAAPLTVYNFMKLAQSGFYDNLAFFRVVPNFVIQGGDPRNDGWGGPGYTIRSEFNNITYNRGCVGMATSGKDSGGSQFFITLSPQPHLDARYTLFGKVIMGMEVVDRIERGDKILRVKIMKDNDKSE